MIYLASLAGLSDETHCSPARLQELETLRNPSLARQKRGAEALLWHAFSHAFPGADFPFDYPRTAAGKPYFPAYPGFQFSLSHTQEYALCAVYPHACGADAEKTGRVTPAVAARFFHPEEQAYLRTLPAPLRSTAAAQIWCLREAYGKALGSGLSGIGRMFWVLPNGESSAGDWIFRAYLPAPGLAAAVCTCGCTPDEQLTSVVL